MSNHSKFLRRAYTGKSLLQLFLVCVFPIHIWSLLMGFRDFSWVALRTNTWDALGLMAYSLVFAFLESTGVFLILVILGFFFPDRISIETKLAFLGTIFMVIAIWAILGQIYSGLRYPLPVWLANLLVQTQHPFRFFWLTIFALTLVSVTLPLLLIAKRDKFKSIVLEVFERISTVSFLYIFFDLISVVIITIRNVSF